MSEMTQNQITGRLAIFLQIMQIGIFSLGQDQTLKTGNYLLPGEGDSIKGKHRFFRRTRRGITTTGTTKEVGGGVGGGYLLVCPRGWALIRGWRL